MELNPLGAVTAATGFENLDCYTTTARCRLDILATPAQITKVRFTVAGSEDGGVCVAKTLSPRSF
jgi:hypothetical protein